MADKCGRCAKTVYKQEEMKAVAKVWHKACFKCVEKGCGITLTLKTVLGHAGEIYCSKHVPKAKATQVKDTVSMVTAMNAPKKQTESIGNATKGDQTKITKAPTTTTTTSGKTEEKKVEAKASTSSTTETTEQVQVTEQPTEQVQVTETPTEQPTETPTEQPTETPTEQPTETPTEQPTETPSEQPTETVSEQPVENTEQPVSEEPAPDS